MSFKIGLSEDLCLGERGYLLDIGELKDTLKGS